MLDIETKQAAPGEGMTRRGLMSKVIGFGAASVAIGVTGKAFTVAAQDVSAEHHTEQPYTVTSALNLRTGPGTSYKVILVMPKGATVYLQQRYENGFYYVSYKGQLGWAHHDYIAPASGPSDPVIVGSKVTAANVNLRSGPSTGHQVLRVVAKGSTVKVSNTVQNGYRYVVHNGLAGWIADQYLTSGGTKPDPVEIGTAVTTANLNLRSGPSTGHTVLDVVAKGATVTITDAVQNGYRYVIQHSGPAGWVIDSGLSRSGQPGETFTTTARLNLRAQPSLSADILLVMLEGATVQAAAGTSGSFRQVIYKGTTGWAATAYLN